MTFPEQANPPETKGKHSSKRINTIETAGKATFKL
jgi:hypothetical protein